MTDHNRFNKSRNIEKSINGLMGILSGVTADECLNEKEVLFLEVWLKSNECLMRDGDVIDLLDLVRDILQDGHVSKDELEDLKQLCVDILDFKTVDRVDIDKQINEFLGILQGVTADGYVNIKEFIFVEDWIESHKCLYSIWPIDVVFKQIININADGKVTEQELSEFAEILKKLTGNRFDETGSADGSATEFLQTELDELNFSGSFCFTGKFVSGPRKELEELAVARGATLKKGVSKQLDYLVIGSIASKDWMFTSHGRKVENAVKLQRDGSSMKIITEKVWLEFVS